MTFQEEGSLGIKSLGNSSPNSWPQPKSNSHFHHHRDPTLVLYHSQKCHASLLDEDPGLLYWCRDTLQALRRPSVEISQSPIILPSTWGFWAWPLSWSCSLQLLWVMFSFLLVKKLLKRDDRWGNMRTKNAYPKKIRVQIPYCSPPPINHRCPRLIVDAHPEPLFSMPILSMNCDDPISNSKVDYDYRSHLPDSIRALLSARIPIEHRWNPCTRSKQGNQSTTPACPAWGPILLLLFIFPFSFLAVICHFLYPSSTILFFGCCLDWFLLDFWIFQSLFIASCMLFLY